VTSLNDHSGRELAHFREPFWGVARLFHVCHTGMCHAPLNVREKHEYVVLPSWFRTERVSGLCPKGRDALRLSAALLTLGLLVQVSCRPGVPQCLAFFFDVRNEIQVLAAPCPALNQRGEGLRPSGPTLIWM